MNASRIYTLRDAGAVKRLHTVRTHRHQSLAEHSWGVAMLVLADYPAASAELLRAALVHDLHELATGDIPAAAKWASPALETALREIEARWDEENGLTPIEISGLEWGILKWCDHMELALTMEEEAKRGNQYAREVFDRIVNRLADIRPPTAEAAGLLVELIEKEIRNGRG